MYHPTIGRKLHYFPGQIDLQPIGANGTSSMTSHNGNLPMTAEICYVWGPRMVNLLVIDHAGVTHRRTSVPIVLPDDSPASTGSAHAVWPERA